jgi:hypothetical protein
VTFSELKAPYSTLHFSKFLQSNLSNPAVLGVLGTSTSSSDRTATSPISERGLLVLEQHGELLQRFVPHILSSHKLSQEPGNFLHINLHSTNDPPPSPPFPPALPHKRALAVGIHVKMSTSITSTNSITKHLILDMAPSPVRQ